MKHELRLNPSPFSKIKTGTKTFELRLYDEKRRKIKVGDEIEFTNLGSDEKLLVEVTSLLVYPSFEELYKHYDKQSIGYAEDEVADFHDMEKYYPLEKQEEYEVVAIGIKVIKSYKISKESETYIGEMVDVKIDRPFGSKHPKHGFIYPVNYGYVPGTVSGDGEELDAYILGVFEPVQEFTGKCIAVIRRTNDDDDKLVVVPKGKKYDISAIDALIEFQEQYFNHIVITKE